MEKIEIKGAIIPDGEQWIYDWFGIPATSPQKVNKALEKAKDKDVEVVINSGGGSVFAGSEIYTSFKEYKGKTTGKIVGLSASAASVISMGIDKLLISPTAQIMIHNAKMYGDYGDKKDFAHASDILDGIDKSIAMAYEIKTGLGAKELLDLMQKETWLTAKDAKELGFVDEIMFIEETNFNNNISVNSDGTLPQIVINKVRDELIKNKESENSTQKSIDNVFIEDTIKNTTEQNLQLAKARLKLITI